MRARAALLTVGSVLLCAGLPQAAAYAAGAPQLPRSIAALGDSLTVAQNGGGLKGSWSTGTNASVNSHFTRLAGQVHDMKAMNYAQAGKKVSALDKQAKQAVSAKAEYVTILIGTNDVCRDQTPVAQFKAQFTTAMNTLAAGPATRIFVASIPDWSHLYQVYKDTPAATAKWNASNGPCPAFLRGPNPAAAGLLSQLNGALAQVCTPALRCVFDNGAVFREAFGKGDYSTKDYFHFSKPGQARLAALTFPLAFPSFPAF